MRIDVHLGGFITDENGKASIFGLEPDTYRIAVYTKHSKIIIKENIYVEKGKTTKVNISIDVPSN